MRNTRYSNTLFYLTIVGLYIYESVLGALGQIGLGIFQLVYAICISLNNEKLSFIGKKMMKVYWSSIIIWLITCIILGFLGVLEHQFEIMMAIIPMLIGLYFTVVIYLIYKNQKS